MRGLRRRLGSQVTTASRMVGTATAAMVGSMLVTSGLGFAFWWVAAQQFSKSEVGVAASAVSAMMLFGTFGMLGLGTLLVRETSERPRDAASLVSTALVTVTAVGAATGVAFTLVAPVISPELELLRVSLLVMTLFAVGVGLTSAGEVLDEALVGLLRPGVQFTRNVVFAVGKLALLPFVATLAVGGGVGILLSWVGGLAVSLLMVAGYAAWRGASRRMLNFRWDMVPHLRRDAMLHHALNLAMMSPGWVLPVLTTAILSAEATASFYVAWMIVSIAYFIPGSLTFSLYVLGSRQPARTPTYARITLSLSVIGAFASVVGILVLGAPVLGLYGAAYAENAAAPLAILAVGTVPLAVKNHYVSIKRIRGELGVAAVYATVGGLMWLIGAALGMLIRGLEGMAIGLVGAMFLEAVVVMPAVWKEARRPTEDDSAVRADPLDGLEQP